MPSAKIPDEPKRYKVIIPPEVEAQLDAMPEEERQVIYDFLFNELAVNPEIGELDPGDDPPTC